MDLKEYFKPNSEEKYQDQNNWQSTQLGHQIYSHNLNQFPEYKFCEIAFFNVREYEGSLNLTTDKECKIRSELYDLHFDKCLRICDLGFLEMGKNRKDSFKNLENVCVELLNNGIHPLVIGGGHDVFWCGVLIFYIW